MLIWLEVEVKGSFPKAMFYGKPIAFTWCVIIWRDLGLGEQMNVRPDLQPTLGLAYPFILLTFQDLL